MSDSPPIVVVVLDGTRIDHLSCYGHGLETSPALDSLADDALVFERAYTPGAWSLPAHTSLFTGLYPSEHGATNVFGGELARLPEAVPTLAESLGRRGYRTAGLSNNPWLGPHSGLDRGFELFQQWDLQLSAVPDDWVPTRRERLYSRLHTLLGKASRRPLSLLKDRFFVTKPLSTARRWMVEHDDPTFTFMNLMGAHNPYYPPTAAFQELGLDRPGFLGRRRLNMRILRDQQFGGGMATSNTDRVREFYDASIRAQDDAFGDFLDVIERAGVYDEALIVVTSDHGKTLGEFDRDADPPHYIRDVNVNVPLVVKLPHQHEGHRVTAPFELVRVYDFLSQASYDRESLLDHRSEYALLEEYVPHTAADRRSVTRWRAITDGDRKYIVDESGDEYVTEGTGVDEAIVDPGDRLEDLREAFEEKLAVLDTDLDFGEGRETELDSDARAQLEDLGYLQ